MGDKVIYKLNDEISFRRCSLSEEGNYTYGDCTNFRIEEVQYQDFYKCNQLGIHLHCSKHIGYELNYLYDEVEEKAFLICPKCKNKIQIQSFRDVQQQCLTMLNAEIFKDAKFVRLDDWYIPEIKSDKEKVSDYWVKTEVKTDKDGDTIVVIYVGNKNNKQKTQLFVKPEKLQLTHDFKDQDPATVLSKIELTLKDRKITQEYDDEI